MFDNIISCGFIKKVCKQRFSENRSLDFVDRIKVRFTQKFGNKVENFLKVQC